MVFLGMIYLQEAHRLKQDLAYIGTPVETWPKNKSFMQRIEDIRISKTMENEEQWLLNFMEQLEIGGNKEERWRF